MLHEQSQYIFLSLRLNNNHTTTPTPAKVYAGGRKKIIYLPIFVLYVK